MTKIDLSNNNIQKVENLVSLQNLKELNLSHNLIKKLNGFDSVKGLRVLDLSYNFIGMVNFLIYLELFVDSIQGLSMMPMLDDLNLSHNRISDITPLRENKHLM